MYFVILLILLLIYQTAKRVMNRKTDSVKCLIGKTAIVTGGNSGLGYGTAVLLASRGCKVIIADCNNGEKSRDEMIKMTGNPNISYKYLDLSSLQNIRDFADGIKKTEAKIDFLINIAGIGFSAKQATGDGLNFVMQVNYFGSFLLTHLLLDSLKAANDARIVFNASFMIFLHELTMENFNKTNYELNPLNARIFYAHSKLCNLIEAQQFSKRLKKYGIAVNCVDPMAVRTPIFENSDKITGASFSRKFILTSYLFLFGQRGIEAAETILHLVTSDKLDNECGLYSYCLRRPYCWMIPKITTDEAFCDQLWEESERLVKLRPEEKL